jgi:DNA polymerase/3'-5' exonuclease PolX
MELKDAQGLAIEICQYIKNDCEENKIHIAGSIRRKKHEVKDIEIVLLMAKRRGIF